MIRRETLASRVFDYLFAQIKSGHAKPGDKLPTEKELTATLGVSRTCVREAVKSLQALQLVTVRPAVGAVVKQPPPGAWFNAYLFAAAIQSEQRDAQIEFRKILEVGLVSLAAEKASDADLFAMSKSISDYEKAIRAGDGRAQAQADLDFHTAVAVASKNPIAEMVWRSVASPFTDQVQTATVVPNAALEGLRDHLRLFSAISRRNPEKARAAMRAHLENAERNFMISKNRVAPPPPKDVSTVPMPGKRAVNE